MTIQQMILAAAGDSGAGLYAFSQVTFTPGGKTGATGPDISQVRSGMSGDANMSTWNTNTSYLNVYNGQIQWTVPITATYEFDAYGAGMWTFRQGGYGARMKGRVSLTQGDVIRILVGQQGQSGGSAAGGTFVVRSPYTNNTNIIVCAGGGGGGHSNGNQSNSHANTGTSGQAGSPAYHSSGPSGGAGYSGYGGQGADASGGGGFYGNGSNGGYSHAQGGFAYTNGGYGGNYNNNDSRKGGFGGGGVSGSSHGAGGGGYSGGGGTGAWPWHGGGGGSYMGSGVTSVTQSMQAEADDGHVTISLYSIP